MKQNLDYLWNGKLDRYEKYIYPAEDSRQRPMFSAGVYFLWSPEGLQYVGQSNFVWERVTNQNIVREWKKKGQFAIVTGKKD